MTIDTAKERERLAKLDGHTSDPWFVDGPKGMSIETRVHRVINGDRFPSAFVPAWDRPDPGEVDGTDEAIANARLIAAAPDLKRDYLAALDVIDAQAAIIRDLLAVYAEPDSEICCSGHHCACGGATTRQLVEYYARAALTGHDP